MPGIYVVELRCCAPHAREFEAFPVFLLIPFVLFLLSEAFIGVSCTIVERALHVFAVVLRPLTSSRRFSFPFSFLMATSMGGCVSFTSSVSENVTQPGL